MRKSSKHAVSRSASTSSYVVIIPSKNGEATIRQTLNSVLEQTIPPKTVIVIDDASTDKTPEILNEFPIVRKIRLDHNLPKDFARVPKLINLGFNQIVTPCDYLMISGDDCIFPARYVELLLSEFEHDPGLLIVSGSHMAQKIVEQASPHGAGRIIAYDFLRTIFPFPESIGWESWVLFKALQKGGRIKRIPEVLFKHMRPYSRGSVRTFGQSMYELGYPFWFVVARVLKDAVAGPDRLRQFHMLRGYLEYLFKHKPRLDVADFVAEYQTQRIRNLVTKSLSGLTRRRRKRLLDNLLVLGSYGPVAGGVETVLHSVVPRLANNFEILVIAPRRRRRFQRDFRDAHITVKYQACGSIPRLTVSQPFVKLARIWHRVRKEVSSFEPDVVWANDESLLMAARLAGFDNIVTTMHGLAREAIEAEREVMGAFDWALSRILVDRYTRKALKHASVITTYSNYLRNRMKSLYDPKVPIYVVPNGVDPDLFHPVSAERKNVITYVGRFARIKGVHILLRAMKIVRAKYPAWKLWLVGDTFDQSMGYFKSIYNEGVTWTGYVPHENLLNIWKQSKICVVPSWGEGFEIALMEAVASGVPSITTGAAERKEIYTDLVTFCALNNPAALADKIIYVIENWDEQYKKALRASELARKRYSWCSIANEYLRILKHML